MKAKSKKSKFKKAKFNGDKKVKSDVRIFELA